jgi:hypothetical protein
MSLGHKHSGARRIAFARKPIGKVIVASVSTPTAR